MTAIDRSRHSNSTNSHTVCTGESQLLQHRRRRASLSASFTEKCNQRNWVMFIVCKSNVIAFTRLRSFDETGLALQCPNDIAFESERRDIANRLSEAHVRLEAVKSIPEVARSLPKPDHLQTVAVGGGDSSNLPGLLAQVLGVLEGYGVMTRRADGANGSALPPEPPPPSSEPVVSQPEE